MKIKEIDRTANTAWSPKACYPIYLAAGTAAQQLDSSFSTTSSLELYNFDVNSPGLDMPLKASLPCQNRFHKLVWGSHGMGSEDKDKHMSGILVGGCDGGVMEVYDAGKILDGDEQPLVLSKNKHVGAVRALDFNSFRSYLIASGASESDILIWDLNNPKTPMSPGAKTQPPDDVTCLAWNKQVEHILASTFSTRCVVWDLRKNEPIIKLADATARIRYKVVAWHPAVATQMCLGSEDDSNPVIQLWDLRYATSPLKTMVGHERGVLGLAWSQDDPELLLSCGKDNRIHCWNPNFAHPGYEMVCDIPTSCQWSFDVSFCPRNPVVISTSSFDGRISIFGLSGGSQLPVTTSKLADSFPGMDMDLTHTPVPSQKPAAVHLRDAPKWLKRPCGASFGFGGKLIHFSNTKEANHAGGEMEDKRLVTISQIVTLPQFIARSEVLEQALESGSLTEFCQGKALKASDPSNAKVWEFLGASFLQNPNQAYLTLLGFEPESLQTKRKQLISTSGQEAVDTITDGFVSLGRGVPDGFGSGQHGSGLAPPSENGSASAFDTFSQTSTRSVTPEPEKLFPILTDETTEGLLNQALICGNLEFAVDLCLKDCRWADALILASTGGPELIKKAQIKYFHKCENETSNMVRAVVTRDLRRLVEKCDLDCWKQGLATTLTYADNPAEFTYLAEILGRRLELSKNEELRKSSLLCYICCGNINRLAESWGSSDSLDSSGQIKPDELQDIVEQVMILRKASEFQGKGVPPVSGPLAAKLVEYAAILVSQGCLQSSVQYLNDVGTEPSMLSLKERVYFSLGLNIAQPSPISPVRHQRSRQASESGRHPLLTKRPSYPSSSSQQQSPSLMASSLFDSRRMSAMNDGLNISALTGPVQPPPLQTSSYDPNNPYGSPQHQQQPSSLLSYNQPGQPGQANTGSMFSPALPPPAERKPSMPVSSYAQGSWNDPPFLASKPSMSTQGQSHSQPPPPTMGLGQAQPTALPVASFDQQFPPPPPSIQNASLPPMPRTSAPSFVPPPLQTPSYDAINPYGNPQQQQQPSSLLMYSSYNQPGQSVPVNTGSMFNPAPPAPAERKPPMAGPAIPVSSYAQGSWNDPPFLAPKPPISTQGQSHSQPPPPISMSSTQAPPTALPVASFAPPPPSIQNASLPPMSRTSAPPLAPLPPQTPTFDANNPYGNPQLQQQPSSLLMYSSYNQPGQSDQANTGSMFSPALPPPAERKPTMPGPAIPVSSYTHGSWNDPPFHASKPSMSTQGQSLSQPPPSMSMSLAQGQSHSQPPPPTMSISLTQAQPTAPPVASFDQPFAPPPPSIQNASLPPAPRTSAPSSVPPAKQAEPKGPIPSQHLDLSETFEKLRSESYARATLPQMKRKLEDVGRKLELFNDKLRNGGLSGKTLDILHNMIQGIQRQDYKSALETHTQLVTAGNFAEISSFAPAVKILIQTASQLGVFI